MRELFRDIMIGLTVLFAGISAYYQSHPPALTDPPAAQAVAQHPTGGLALVAVLFLIAGVLNVAPLLLRLFRRNTVKATAEENDDANIATLKHSDVEGYTSSWLRNQAHQIANARLDELAADALLLQQAAPTEGANQAKFCEVWAGMVRKWRNDVISLLGKHWGDREVAYFESVEGYNKNESVGNVLPGAADAYRDLLYCQRNLKNLRRPL
jgi:hypothetical protein